MEINTTTIFMSGIIVGLVMGKLILDFCKYKDWIRETTSEERRTQSD